MTNELTMISRYSLMIITGYLLNQGYINGSLQEPIIALGVALFGYAWKKYEDYKKRKKNV